MNRELYFGIVATCPSCEVNVMVDFGEPSWKLAENIIDALADGLAIRLLDRGERVAIGPHDEDCMRKKCS